MDVVLHAHVIPYIGTPTQANKKAQVILLDMYFDELMRVATNANLANSVETMHQYAASLAAPKTMMHILSDELDRGAKAVYADATEARVHF